MTRPVRGAAEQSHDTRDVPDEAAWVEHGEGRHRLTLEALADVDAGRAIDHAVVQAWADSLDTPHPRSPPETAAI